MNKNKTTIYNINQYVAVKKRYYIMGFGNQAVLAELLLGVAHIGAHVEKPHSMTTRSLIRHAIPLANG